MGIRETLGVGRSKVLDKLDLEHETRLRNLDRTEDVEVIHENIGGLLRTFGIATQLRNGVRETNSANSDLASATSGINLISKDETLRPLKPVLTTLIKSLMHVNKSIYHLHVGTAIGNAFSDRAYDLLKKQEKEKRRR